MNLKSFFKKGDPELSASEISVYPPSLPSPDVSDAADPFFVSPPQKHSERNAVHHIESLVADLEKKITEERDRFFKSFMASKEQELISAKVEVSLGEMQDKVRRNKREQELLAEKQKSEAKIAELEQRLADERETWATVLRSKILQQVSSREGTVPPPSAFKSMESFWTMARNTIEKLLCDRDEEIKRLRDELVQKQEKERSIWEERMKTVASEKERYQRELEELSAKSRKEWDQLIQEKFKLQTELIRTEGQNMLVSQQLAAEKEMHERRIGSLEEELKNRVNVPSVSMPSVINSPEITRDQTSEKVDSLNDSHTVIFLKRLLETKDYLIHEMQEKVKRLEETAAKLSEAADKTLEVPEAPPVDVSQIEEKVRTEMVALHETEARAAEAEMNKQLEEFKQKAEQARLDQQMAADEAKRLRKETADIREEAQELILEAEAFYKDEVEKQSKQTKKALKESEGFFMTIARFLDWQVWPRPSKPKSDNETSN